jgi:hypothetical protein
VLLASSDQRLVEDILGHGQRLGVVESGEDGLGDGQAAVAQPGDPFVAGVAFSVEPCSMARGCLVASMRLQAS